MPKMTRDAHHVQVLPGVGQKTATHLERLGIRTLTDLLLHFPLRYQDRTKITPIKFARASELVVVEGMVRTISEPTKGKTKLLCTINDGTGKLHLRFFKIFPYQRTLLQPGNQLRCIAPVKMGTFGLEMVHPEITLLQNQTTDSPKTLTPFYPSTEGLSQLSLRKMAHTALDWLHSSQLFADILPSELCADLNLPTSREALAFIHHPPAEAEIAKLMAFDTPSHQRLIFEELVAHRVSMQVTKNLFQNQKSKPLLQKSCTDEFLQQLPFALTSAQQRVIKEISADLEKPNPMLRLVQGDVGSGKTIVAAAAMLQAVANGYQAALMAPTELLAEQHYRNFKSWLEPLGLRVQFLSSACKSKAKKNTLSEVEIGACNVIIGTHALFQDSVTFEKLALIVVDEQHRFGVQQRAQLLEKGVQAEHYPHQLILSATPIPRTLAMTFYADLDYSVIDELPPGRTPVNTSVVPNTRRHEVIERLREGCAQGKQAYWVCPLIEESEALNCQAATIMAQELKQALCGQKIGLVHGRMKSSEKEHEMAAFKNGEIDILVATTVIEVGVDVPNASIMVIENAERLGLSQLHQLRGRVGRGSTASHCVLLYQGPLSERGRERLQIIRDSTDGFVIAQRDLELRGAGEVLGTRQTGELSFRIADLMRDSHLLSKVQEVADKVMQFNPEIIVPLMDRWLRQGQAFAKV